MEDEQASHICEAQHRAYVKFDFPAIYWVQGGATWQWAVVRDLTDRCAEQEALQERLLDLSKAHLLRIAVESRPCHGAQPNNADN